MVCQVKNIKICYTLKKGATGLWNVYGNRGPKPDFQLKILRKMGFSPSSRTSRSQSGAEAGKCPHMAASLFNDHQGPWDSQRDRDVVPPYWRLYIIHQRRDISFQSMLFPFDRPGNCCDCTTSRVPEHNQKRGMHMCQTVLIYFSWQPEKESRYGN